MSTRIISALVALAIFIPALVFGGVIAVEVLVGLVLAVGLTEHAAMIGDKGAGTWRMLVAGALVYVGVLWGGDLAGTAVVAAALLLFTSAVMRPGEVERAFEMCSRHIFGVLWVIGLGLHLVLLRRLDHGLEWLGVLMLIVISADSGAYFTGRAFGKRKLYEKVSPKKTWEGVWGGLATAVVALFVARATFADFLSPVDCVVLGVGVAAVAVVGDLAESLVKRAVGVKDSGRIMPGHGGALDRVDSLLFGAPVLYHYITGVSSLGL